MIHIALPVLNEEERLPACLESLAAQAQPPECRLWICVNQPESWWQDPGKRAQCEANQRTLAWLREQQPAARLLDHSSPGRGWPAGREGIGQARHALLAAILEEDAGEGLFLSLDADTRLEPEYLRQVEGVFARHPEAAGLAAPYRHPLGESEAEDRAVLRYEFYLRHYLLCLLYTESPWAFTAIGSGMAARLSVCRRIGGLTPKKSGEDFYFLQKLRKYGPLALHLSSRVLPAGRFSQRVIFGTGPAMVKGHAGDWESYPLYALRHFEEVRRSMDLFGELQHKDIPLPVTQHCPDLLGPDPWSPLRRNHPRPESFRRACREKLDALRLLQYLRQRRMQEPASDEDELTAGLAAYGGPGAQRALETVLSTGGLLRAPLERLAQLRGEMEILEDAARRKQDRRSFEPTGRTT